MTIRTIQPTDNRAIASVIRTALHSFGADKPGFASKDPETDAMYEAYQNDGTVYFIALLDNQIVGGAGIGKLKGGDADISELQKMYLSENARGCGIGSALMKKCLAFAKAHGYGKCYIETLDRMSAARALYEKYGFQYLDKPLGNTGHHGCNYWMIKHLDE